MLGKKIDEFMYYVPFLKEVIKRDFKKKYYKSVLGVAWSMLSPLLMMIVITIIFSTIFKRNIPYYPSYWLGGNLIFAFVMGNVPIVEEYYPLLMSSCRITCSIVVIGSIFAPPLPDWLILLYPISKSVSTVFCE